MALGNVGSMAVALLGDMKDFDRKMDGATKKVSTFDKTVGKMGKAVTKAAKAAALAAAAAVTAFGVSAVKTFVEFDTGMREVFTLMPELSAEAREAMEEDVKALSEQIAVLPEEVIPALYQAISAGVPQDTVFSFLEIAGKAAIGGVTSLETAVDGLTTVTNAYGSEVISVTEVADIMFTTVKEGKTTFDELSARLFQAVPVAAKIGLEFRNVAAAAAQITLSGVPMRVAMTQIRSLLNEVAFEGKELNKVFQEASGMTFPQYIDSGGDIAGVIEILQGAADDAGISIAELTANLEAQGALLNLSGVSLGNLKEILDEMANSAGAADKAYEEMAAGVQYEINQLKVWWQNLKLDIGGDLTENLKDLLGWLEDNREAIGDGIKSIFDSLIDGMEWVSLHGDGVKKGLIAISVGLSALVAINMAKWVLTLGGALASLSPVVLAALVALGGLYAVFEGSEAILEGVEGGVELVAEQMSDLASMLPGVRLGMGSVGSASQSLENRMYLLTASFDALAKANPDQAENLASIAAEIAELYEQVKDAPDLASVLESGNWNTAINNILGEWTTEIPELNRLIYTVPEAAERAAVLLNPIIQSMTGMWFDLSDAVSDAADEVDKATDDIEKEVIGLGVGLTQVQREVLADELDRIADDAVATYERVRDAMASWLTDMIWDLATFHRKTEAAEEDHQRRMEDIIEGAADSLEGINLGDQRRREDLQTSHNRKLQDIQEWYQEQVAQGEANTYEKKAALDAARQSKIEDAEKTHKRALEDLDTDYTRAVDDNADDREEAIADELTSYEEDMPKISTVFSDAWDSMKQTIIDTALNDMIQGFIDKMWAMATETDLAVKDTNTALDNLGGGGGLPWQAAVPLWVASDEGAEAVSEAGSFLNDMFDTFFSNSRFASQNKPGGSAYVGEFASGGIVPGPIGAPQMAIVHGGEEVLTPGDRGIDYELLGQAVAAGFMDAQDERGGNGDSSGSSSDLLTRLAQLLYNPTEVERERRGGTA